MHLANKEGKEMPRYSKMTEENCSTFTSIKFIWYRIIENVRSIKILQIVH